MKKMKYLGHQGDVCIFEVDAFPKERIENKQTKNAIMAYGELSGHAHQLDDLESANVFLAKDPALKGLLFINVKKQVDMSHGRARDFVGREADHDYHKPVTLVPDKKYVTGIVEETDWLTRTVRKVVD